MSATCREFTQNAWRKDLCVNCLRHRSEHEPNGDVVNGNEPPTKKPTTGTDPGSTPKVAKRTTVPPKPGVESPTYKRKINESCDDQTSSKCSPGSPKPIVRPMNKNITEISPESKNVSCLKRTPGSPKPTVKHVGDKRDASVSSDRDTKSVETPAKPALTKKPSEYKTEEGSSRTEVQPGSPKPSVKATSKTIGEITNVKEKTIVKVVPGSPKLSVKPTVNRKPENLSNSPPVNGPKKPARVDSKNQINIADSIEADGNNSFLHKSLGTTAPTVKSRDVGKPAPNRKEPKVSPDKPSKSITKSSKDVQEKTNTSINGHIDVVSNKKTVIEEKNVHVEGIIKTSKEAGKKKVIIRVGFSEKEPEVIGHDGGLEELQPQQSATTQEDKDRTNKEPSLSEAEKQFAFLALENTLWNSNAQNLKTANELEGRLKRAPSKEFEDVELETLWEAQRFSNVRDCEMTERKYGTFPLRTKVYLPQNDNQENGNFTTDQQLYNAPWESLSEKLEAAVSSCKDTSTFNDQETSSTSSLSLATDSGQSSGSSSGSGSSGSKPKTTCKALSKPSIHAYTVVDISSNSHVMYPCEKSPPLPTSPPIKEERQCNSKSGSLERGDNVAGEKDDAKDFSKFDYLFAGTCLSSSDKDSDISKTSSLLSDSSDSRKTSDDVFESSDQTDTGFERQTLGRGSKGKTVAFEAKLASVAASLENSKAKKRSAPRPPSSPPPEPPTSPITSEPPVALEPSMITSISEKNDPPSSPLPASRKPIMSSTSEDMTENIEGFRIKTERAKKGITSFFRSLMRRGKDSGENSEGSSICDDDGSCGAEKESESIPVRVNHDAPQVSSATSVQKQDGAEKPTTPPVKVFPSPILPHSNIAVKKSPEIVPKAEAAPKPEPSTGIASSAVEKIGHRVESAITDEIRKSPRLSRSLTKAPRASPPARPKSIAHTNHKEPIPQERPLTIAEDPSLVQRRLPSPKKSSAPSRPIPASAGKPLEAKNKTFAKELEMKLSKPGEGKSTLKKMTNKSTAPHPPSPSSPTLDSEQTSPPSPTTNEIKADDQQSIRESQVIDKVELPKAAQSRRSFLGKFNKKSRPPPPPSVKRTKSITEPPMPLHEIQVKKIDLSDISGPVLITSMQGKKTVPVHPNRRNTISLGEDSAFGSGGSSSSGSGGEPLTLSPLGSLENVYEPIGPKFNSNRRKGNFYDPVDTNRSSSTSGASTATTGSLQSEGYLEPIKTTLGDPGKVSSLERARTIVIEPIKSSASNSEAAGSIMSESVNASIRNSVIPELPKAPEESDDPNYGEGEYIDEERQRILSTQPIYEEINGYTKDMLKPNEEDATLNIKPKSPNLSPRPMPLGPKPTPRAKSTECLAQEPMVQAPIQGFSTLGRPRPQPRKRPRPPAPSPEQYVPMKTPSIDISKISESAMQDGFVKMITLNFETLQNILSKIEPLFSPALPQWDGTSDLRWQDFDVRSKQTVCSSEQCVVYKMKYKEDSKKSQLVIFQCHPDLDYTVLSHPNFISVGTVYPENIPTSQLPEKFRKKSPLAEPNKAESACQECFIAASQYSSVESIHRYFATLGLTMQHNRDSFLHLFLFAMLQIHTAVLHCLDQGYIFTGNELNDILIVTTPDIDGKYICIVPHSITHGSGSQAGFLCGVLHRFFRQLVETNFGEDEHTHTTFVGLQRVLDVLELEQAECLAQARAMLDLLLWGPSSTELKSMKLQADEEPFDLWIESERAVLVNKFAELNVDGAKLTMEELYRTKFLVNSIGASLLETSMQLLP